MTRSTQIEVLSDWSAQLDSSMLVLGPGLDKAPIRAAIGAGLVAHDPALNYPDGSRLIELTRDAWTGGRRDDPWLLEPHYLRRSAAEEKWDTRNPARPGDSRRRFFFRKSSCLPPIRLVPSRHTECSGIGSGSYARTKTAPPSTIGQACPTKISPAKSCSMPAAAWGVICGSRPKQLQG